MYEYESAFGVIAYRVIGLLADSLVSVVRKIIRVIRLFSIIRPIGVIRVHRAIGGDSDWRIGC